MLCIPKTVSPGQTHPLTQWALFPSQIGLTFLQLAWHGAPTDPAGAVEQLKYTFGEAHESTAMLS